MTAATATTAAHANDLSPDVIASLGRLAAVRGGGKGAALQHGLLGMHTAANEAPPAARMRQAQLEAAREPVERPVAHASNASTADSTEEAQQPQPEPASKADLHAAVARLAQLKPLDYDRVRESEANALGVRVGTLDAEVKRCHGKTAPETGQGASLDLPDTEPWDEPVDGAVLIGELSAMVRRCVVLPVGADLVIALWVVLTHAIEAVDIAPILAVTAPDKGCGKTTVLDLLGKLVDRPLSTSNISTAALFRMIDRRRPTLLIDEFDSFYGRNDELRGVLNSGHTRQTAYVIRCVGDDAEPRQFSTWAAKAIAGIGELPPTIADRSIAIRLRRALPHEAAHIEKLRHVPRGEFQRLARMAARWVIDHAGAIRAARPVIPKELSNRAEDNAAPLLAIAETVGGDLPKRARDAIVVVLSDVSEETASTGQLLLRDIAAIFAARNTDHLPTDDILRALCARDDAPWATAAQGKPMTPYMLAKRLRTYDVTPEQKRYGKANLRGYMRAPIEDAARRYATTQQASAEGATSATSATREGKTRTAACDVADWVGATHQWTIPRRANDVADVADVAGFLSPLRWPAETRVVYRAPLQGAPLAFFPATADVGVMAFPSNALKH